MNKPFTQNELDAANNTERFLWFILGLLIAALFL